MKSIVYHDLEGRLPTFDHPHISIYLCCHPLDQADSRICLLQITFLKVFFRYTVDQSAYNRRSKGKQINADIVTKKW